MRFIRISPRKVRQVIPLISGKPVNEAFAVLENLNKHAARILSKLLKSAVSNAQRNPSIEPENLYISRIYADAGAMLKRYRSAPMGRAVMVRKRTAHINVHLDMIKPIEVKEEKTKRPARLKQKVKAKKAAAAKGKKRPANKRRSNKRQGG